MTEPTCSKILFKVVGAARHSVYAQGKYRRRYLKGQFIRAEKGSLGLMMFEKHWLASQWLDELVSERAFNPDLLEIIKVKAIGKVSYPSHAARTVTVNALDRFYSSLMKRHRSFVETPSGTVASMKVEVLT